jgi:hypothetical protein
MVNGWPNQKKVPNLILISQIQLKFYSKIQNQISKTKTMLEIWKVEPLSESSPSNARLSKWNVLQNIIHLTSLKLNDIFIFLKIVS